MMGWLEYIDEVSLFYWFHKSNGALSGMLL